MKNKQLVYIAGPTAVGKTRLSVELAKHFETEIISCDSRQFYKEMEIGTAVPTAAEMDGVPHHCIQHKSIQDTYSVGDFETEALGILDRLFETKDVVFMVGGSGLYADAVMTGLDQFPPIPNEIREQIRFFYNSHGIESLQDLLRQNDPKHYTQVDKQNPKRLMRALEVCMASGKPYSSFLGQPKAERSFTSKVIVLHCPRTVLYERINHRVEEMIAAGLEAEVKALEPHKNLNALKTVGYNEFFQYFDGQVSLEECIGEIQKNTRRYAKRQITWFKRYEEGYIFPNNTPIDQFFEYI